MATLSTARLRESAVKEAIESVYSLDHWVEKNGWTGYDLHDIRGLRFFLRLRASKNQNLVFRRSREAIMLATDLFPMASRRLLRVPKQVNAKAMGLFAFAYLNLYQQLKVDSFLTKASECLKWLEENKSQGYAGCGWGYPSDWQSQVLIPRNTPSSVVSGICGDAFWNFYQFTGDEKYLRVCQDICDFMLNSLNIDHISDDVVCFSYTPVDNFHVHNANLFSAEFLVRVGKHINREDYYQYGIKAANYTLESQNEDGSFYYWALSDGDVYNIPEAVLKSIDHFHTGFVLRSLYSIYQNSGEKRVYDSLSRGYQFYRDNLFAGGEIPKWTPKSIYSINIHSCSEAIICMCTLSDIFPEALEYAQNAFLWTRKNMQDKDGHFYYLKTKYRIDKMAYLRWGQAWMMRALAGLLAKE